MATPFRRPYVSWRVVSSIGELRGCTISGTRQHAGQAIAPIPRSSGDGPVEIQRVGAAADITKANAAGVQRRHHCTMWIACREGHLSVCQWLFEVGAAADITKAWTPSGCGSPAMVGHLSVCQWLFEVGAAADITKADDEGATPTSDWPATMAT